MLCVLKNKITLQIILRSIAIAFVITIVWFLVEGWYSQAGIEEFREYCISEGKEDPECKSFLTEENELAEGLADEVTILLNFSQLLRMFIIIFSSSFLFGIWNKYYPIKHEKTLQIVQVCGC